MVVIWHQAEAMNLGSVPFGRGFQIAYESLIIFSGLKDRPPLVSTRGDVIKCARIFNPQRPCHDVPYYQIKIVLCRVKEWRVALDVTLAVSAVSSFVPV